MISRRRLLRAGLSGLAVAGLTACGIPRPDRTGSSSTPSTPPLATTRQRPLGPLAGVGAWAGPDTAAGLATAGARWYYTWRPDHEGIVTPDGTEFVPMIQDAKDLTPEAFATAKRNGTTLLGFNEPEVKSQANMSLDEVVRAWPQFMDTGLRLGSPAVSGKSAVPGGYFDQFMTEVGNQGLRVDFVATHWYLPKAMRADYSLSAAVDHLHAYLTAVHDRFGLPIWLTEFSLISWYSGHHFTQPQDRQAEFVRASALMMRELDFVERWAWFALPPVSYAEQISMFDDRGRITPVGEAFREIS